MEMEKRTTADHGEPQYVGLPLRQTDDYHIILSMAYVFYPMPTHKSTHNPWRDIMIDVEDFKPQIKALGQIRDALPVGVMLRDTINNMIRGLREWPKEWDADTPLFQVCRRTHIERGFMLGLAIVVELQWSNA
jgi:hypothetical protein